MDIVTPSHLYNDVGQSPFQLAETVVFVLAIDINSEAILARYDGNSLLENVIPGYMKHTFFKTYFLFDLQFLGSHNSPFDIIQRQFELQRNRLTSWLET